MTTRYILPLLMLIIFICSCENEIDFNKAARPPKLIMNALINADSTNNILYLNKTGQYVISDVTNASVEVRVNDVLVETPKAIPIPTGDFVSLQKRFLITTKFHPGDKVRIDARTEDGEFHAWAEVVVPQPPIPIEKVDTATALVCEYGNYYNRLLRYRITFSDRPDERNYYRLVLERRYTLYATMYRRGTISGSLALKDTVLTQQNFRMLPREDVVLTDGHPTTSEDDENGMFEQAQNTYGVFDDSRFSGQSYTMTVYPSGSDSWPYLFESHDVTRRTLDTYVRILSISETDFQYLKALNLSESDFADDVTMEPVTFASNVHGGLGIVSISTETSVKINISDEKYDPYNPY